MKAKKKMYRKGGKLDAALRAEMKKKTSGKSKPAVKIKDTPMERVANTGAKEKVFKKMSDDIVKDTGMDRMRANQYSMATINMTYPAAIKKAGEEAGAKTYGELADAVEKKYRYGGKVYKDGGRALFNALKKKFGEG